MRCCDGFILLAFLTVKKTVAHAGGRHHITPPFFLSIIPSSIRRGHQRIRRRAAKQTKEECTQRNAPHHRSISEATATCAPFITSIDRWDTMDNPRSVDSIADGSSQWLAAAPGYPDARPAIRCRIHPTHQDIGWRFARIPAPAVPRAPFNLTSQQTHQPSTRPLSSILHRGWPCSWLGAGLRDWSCCRLSRLSYRRRSRGGKGAVKARRAL